MILAATRDAARLFLELGTVTVVLAVGARLAARTGFSSIPLYLIAGIVLGALAPPTLDDVLVTTLSEVGIVLLLFTLGLEYSALELASGLRSGVKGGIFDLALNFPRSATADGLQAELPRKLVADRKRRKEGPSLAAFLGRLSTCPTIARCSRLVSALSRRVACAKAP
jgi:Kef-type K+ transport system membrane component KefB